MFAIPLRTTNCEKEFSCPDPVAIQNSNGVISKPDDSTFRECTVSQGVFSLPTVTKLCIMKTLPFSHDTYTSIGSKQKPKLKPFRYQITREIQSTGKRKPNRHEYIIALLHSLHLSTICKLVLTQSRFDKEENHFVSTIIVI